MADAAVTVVVCGTCHRSGELSLVGDRFWCARCQDWPEIHLERAEGLARIGNPEDPHITAGAPSAPPRQPLRVPPGWLIVYNDFHESDPTDEWTSDDDLFIARHEERDRVVDLGWRFDEESSGWSYRLAVWAGQWDDLVHTSRHVERTGLVAELERVLADGARGRL